MTRIARVVALGRWHDIAQRGDRQLNPVRAGLVRTAARQQSGAWQPVLQLRMSLSQVSANYRRFSISQTGSGDRQTPVSSFRSDSGNLDLIRAAAVLSVLFQHVCDYNRLAPPMIRWHVGQLGVITFFVHTSMVLMLSLERAKLQGTALFGSFYLRRFFRLYPLSVFSVVRLLLPAPLLPPVPAERF